MTDTTTYRGYWSQLNTPICGIVASTKEKPPAAEAALSKSDVSPPVKSTALPAAVVPKKLLRVMLRLVASRSADFMSRPPLSKAKDYFFLEKNLQGQTRAIGLRRGHRWSRRPGAVPIMPKCTRSVRCAIPGGTATALTAWCVLRYSRGVGDEPRGSWLPPRAAHLDIPDNVTGN